MEIFKSYILQNWILILILTAFIVVLIINSFLGKRATRRIYFLIASVFVLSIIVFVEFVITDDPNSSLARLILMSIRYSATPFILALVIYALVKKFRSYIFIPAGVLLIIDIVSIFTGIVFSIDENNQLVRGPLGYLPFIVAGLYCLFMIYILIKRSNKSFVDIIPVIFLAIAFGSGLIFPFILGSSYSQIFCPTIGAALFIYYVFSILQLSKKDALTGLLNRQAYYSDTRSSLKDITAVISLDMNGLKKVNDTYGHDAGDEALITLAVCFTRACKARQVAYRMGGDEFAIVCYKTSLEEVEKLIERINKLVSETKYTCAIGYSYHSYQKDGAFELDDLLKDSDEKMYNNKAEYYAHKK